MRKKMLFILGFVVCVSFAFGLMSYGGLAQAKAKVINLKIANFFPPPAKQSKILAEFGRELEARSNGRIKVQYFPGGSLLKAPAIYKGIVSGIADIGYSHVYYTPGLFPVTEGAGLPLGLTSGWVGAHMAYDFYNKFHPKEWNKVKILCIHDNAPSLIICKKPVRTLADMKGLTIRAPGVPGEIVKALGGTPAPTPMMETYDAIAKGVDDGVFAPYETLKTFRFAEVAKYVTVCWQTGAGFPFYLAMNKHSYNRLPKDLQRLVDVMSGEYQERYALMWNEIELEGKAFGIKQGVHFIELSDQEAAKWVKAVDPVIAEYTKRMESKGYSASQIKGWISYMRERVAYWTKKQMEYKIPSPEGPAGMRPEAYVIK